jgi:REP element-mobilizing transposase RayT
MPRTARVAPGGLVFQVLNRGVARMQLFETPADYQAFEQVLRETLDESPMRICAYAVMPNHWYLLLWPEKRKGHAMQLTFVSVRPSLKERTRNATHLRLGPSVLAQRTRQRKGHAMQLTFVSVRPSWLERDPIEDRITRIGNGVRRSMP